jgi:hypothetical protein
MAMRMKGRIFVGAVGVAAAITAGGILRRDAEAALPQSVRMEMLSSPAGPGAAESNLAVGADGKVYLSWVEPAPDSQMALRFSTLSGTTWAAPRTIRAGKDFFVNWADFPSLSVHPNGRIAAHWLQRFDAKPYAYDVRIATSGDGGRTWGAPVPPHVDRSETEKGFVVMWPEGEGFGAVWLDGRNADKARPNPRQEMMLYATPRAGVSPAVETPLDPRVCDCCQTTIAMTADGPIVAYRDRTADEVRDIYYVRRVGGKWAAPKAVHDDGWKINNCPVNGPMVAAAGKRVALAWFTGAGGTPHVKVAFSSDAGATFSVPVTVDQGSPAGRVASVLLPDGSALVSWLERTGGDTASVLVRRVRETGAGPVSAVASSSAARASGFPRMAISGDYAYFSWTVPGRPSEVHVARAATGQFR